MCDTAGGAKARLDLSTDAVLMKDGSGGPDVAQG
jgi:hypothetical protein